MVSTGIRVVLASDQPDMRRYLARVVQDRLGGVVVGEGENAVRALRLAHRLRPDMAIIDSCLPYNVSLGNVPLSRSAGLDAAQAISAEIPNMRVVLVDSGKAVVMYPDDVEDIMLKASSVMGAPGMALSGPQAAFTFASVQARPRPRKKSGFCDAGITIGTWGILFGLVLTASMFLAYIGLPLLVIGGMSLFVGCLGKLLSPRSTDSFIEDKSDVPGEIRGGKHDE